MKTALHSNLWQFFRVVGDELKRTTWPSQAEMFRSTRIVLGMVSAIGLYLALVDWLLNQLARSLGLFE